ncbi:MATE family efflux transporter, partial [Ralstonia pseudosolanacearum]
MEHSSAIPVAPGRSMQWHRRVLALAFPIVLANLTQPLLSAVDTAVAGHLPGPEYLGGVALGGVFFNFVFWGFGFLRMGTTGLVAQAHGAGDARGLRANVARALL